MSKITDPFQFAYRSKRSCTDAILVMLEKLYHHTDRAREGNSVRIMFFDFSSAFNTIQPHLLVQKLLNHNIPGSILAWILNYLTDRSQYGFTLDLPWMPHHHLRVG